MNGVNLDAFQFDFDLTWMSFFQNADGQTYARYGGRDDTGSESHLTKESLANTMREVLKLHKQKAVKPWSKYEPEPTTLSTPEQIPPMKAMLSKRKESCIHCHDVKNATLHDLANRNLLTKYKVYGYPSPRQLGISVSPKEHTMVQEVVAGSAAAKAGVRSGDAITAIDGQRVLTYADMTRVLELVPESGSVSVEVERAGRAKTIPVKVTSGWRKSPDPSWRPSTNVVGPTTGFWANPINDGQLRRLKLGPNDLGMKVVVVWGAWAKKADVRNGDILIDLDGINSKSNMRQLQSHLHMNREFGDSVDITVIRGGKKKTLTLDLPDRAELH